jgi:hypothetical protein
MFASVGSEPQASMVASYSQKMEAPFLENPIVNIPNLLPGFDETRLSIGLIELYCNGMSFSETNRKILNFGDHGIPKFDGLSIGLSITRKRIALGVLVC